MKKRRGFHVMMRLVGLVEPLAGYMVLAIIMGLMGHLAASFITIFGGYCAESLFGGTREGELMRKDIVTKREREKEIVSQMIALYCKKKHGNKKGLCAECEALEAYAKKRSDKCPFMETKTFCSNCRVHCYQPAMREKIREVMRFSGSRMLFIHPIITIKHVIETKKEKKRLEKES